MITAATRAKITLFNRSAKPDDKEGVTYPAMFGSIENKDFKLNVSAFLKINTNNGKKFLSLVIRNENDEQTFTGTLHRSDKPGKEDTYYGYIGEQYEDVRNGKKEYSSSDWQVGISAEIKVAESSGRKYIGGDVYPLNKQRTSSEKPAAPVDEDLPL